MPYVKNTNYRDLKFSSETPKGEFYTYFSIEDLAKKTEACKEQQINCRTIGILQSKEGRFILTDLDSSPPEQWIRVSMVYLTAPPPSTVVPYPVQIFGSLHWKNRPVIYAQILQVLKMPTAVRLNTAMRGVTTMHLAKELANQHEVIDLT